MTHARIFITKFLRTLFFQNTCCCCFCETLPNMNEVKSIPHRFTIRYYWFQNSCHAEQFPFRVTLSSYLSDQPFFEIAIFTEHLLFRTAIFHNSYLQEQPSKVFYKKSCSTKFCNIHRKTPYWSLFLIKLQTIRAATLLKRNSATGVFL